MQIPNGQHVRDALWSGGQPWHPVCKAFLRMTETGNVPLAPARLSFHMKLSVFRVIAAEGKTGRPNWTEKLSPFPRVLCVLCFGVFVLLFAGSLAPANPAVQARRLIGYQQVDLTPLFYWWEHSQGVRPLQAWKHVQGVLDRQSVYGWMVRGKIEGQTGLQYFLVKNPPTKSLARYRELNDSLARLGQERSSTLAITKLPAYNGWMYDYLGRPVRAPSEDFERIEEAKSHLQEIDQQIAAVRQEMGGMLDRDGYFKVDAFALQLNDLYEGSPVLDCGFPRS